MTSVKIKSESQPKFDAHLSQTGFWKEPVEDLRVSWDSVPHFQVLMQGATCATQETGITTCMWPSVWGPHQCSLLLPSTRPLFIYLKGADRTCDGKGLSSPLHCPHESHESHGHQHPDRCLGWLGSGGLTQKCLDHAGLGLQLRTSHMQVCAPTPCAISLALISKKEKKNEWSSIFLYDYLMVCVIKYEDTPGMGQINIGLRPNKYNTTCLVLFVTAQLTPFMWLPLPLPPPLLVATNLTL